MGVIFGLLIVVVLLAFAAAMLWFVYIVLTEARPRTLVAFVQIVAGVLVGMLSFDRWGEVFDTIRRNKLRTALTAVSVAWGIFVMVVLLGMGHGLNNGIRQSFRREATNGIWISANKTSVPYAGYGLGRHITFDNHDYDHALKVAGIEHLSGQFFIRGGRMGGGEMKIQRGVKSNAFAVNAVHPGAFYMGANEIIGGRFLDAADIAGLRKVCVIGRPVRDFLFPNHEDPIGQWIVIANVAFEVVGVYSDEGGEEEERQIYIPVSTAQLAFHGQDHLGMLELTVGNATAPEAKEISHQIVEQLAAAHQFSPDDPQAARVFDNVEGFSHFQQFFFVISVFVVVIGCGTLAAGVVGVSNIMMIAVKERTREIGIRKALGATPLAIVSMITQEAIFLTSIAGLLGLSAGVFFLQLLPSLVDTDLIRNPSIDIGVGALAAIGLVAAGALAGFVPARAAARVNPVATLRDQ
ncbi:MAG TPA: ABC transporter permease [Kofleriaceae bacterium]|nr:ABC transporter permease [Kofleriaceae bacterium]